MKYIAIFDDNFLSNFRLDDGGLTLVLRDKSDYNRAVKLMPIIKPVLTITEDCEGATSTNSLYLTQGYIDAMVEYEKEQIRQEVFESILGNLNGTSIVEPRIEYGTDGQPYKMSMTSGEVDDVSPCTNCHEWDCYGCKVKEADNDTRRGIETV